MIIYYHDPDTHFYPLDLFRHQAKLLIGTTPFWQRRKGMFLIPSYLKGLYAEPRCRGVCIYLKATVIIEDKLPSLKQDTVLESKEGVVIGAVITTDPYPQDSEDLIKRIRTIKDKKRLRAVEFRSLWEMVDQNGKVIISDYSGPSREGSVDKRATILGKDLAMARGTKIDPGAIIDTRSGPVIIGEKVWIKSNSVIEGPAYIGPETIIEGAKVRPGTTIGKNCRIGGEVETSIILDFTNKHHDGFIGHSYIGSWVNLGALTTNSDLKNNYHQVRIRYKDKSFETGLLKVGCFIGDHVKTGIGTLIPTGCVIGPFTNVFGGGMVERFIPAFRWGSPGKYQDYDLERAIETAKLVMSRRGVRLDKNYEKVIRTVYQRERTGK